MNPTTLEIYSIKDDLLGFSQPFLSNSEAVALRSFIASVRASEPNAANTFPENKSLYRLGTINIESGSIVSDVVFIARAITYLETSKE